MCFFSRFRQQFGGKKSINFDCNQNCYTSEVLILNYYENCAKYDKQISSISWDAATTPHSLLTPEPHGAILNSIMFHRQSDSWLRATMGNEGRHPIPVHGRGRCDNWACVGPVGGCRLSTNPRDGWHLREISARRAARAGQLCQGENQSRLNYFKIRN